MTRRKARRLTIELTISTSATLTSAEIRREVRTLINEQSNYLECDRDGRDILLRAVKVRAMPKKKPTRWEP